MAEGEKQPNPNDPMLPAKSEIGIKFADKLWDISRKTFPLHRTDPLRERYPLSFSGTPDVWHSIDYHITSTHKNYTVPLIDAQTGGFYAATKNFVADRIKREPEEIERLSVRAKSLASFMNQLLIPEGELESDDTIHSARLIDFILDEDITQLWLDLGEEPYKQFFQSLQDRKLPTCLTSDEETKRVSQDFQEGLRRDFQHMVNISRGAVMEDVLTPQPDRIAARQRLLVLCADEDGKINPSVNIADAFSILEKEYPL